MGCVVGLCGEILQHAPDWVTGGCSELLTCGFSLLFFKSNATVYPMSPETIKVPAITPINPANGSVVSSVSSIGAK